MWTLRCPYCPGTHGRCATSASGRSVTECSVCGRVVEERQPYDHPLFLLRAHDSPLPLVTPDLSSAPRPKDDADDDPFEPTGFITAFSTWSLERAPLFARSASSFAGHLAELERALVDPSSSGSSAATDGGGPLVSVDHLRAYLQILDVASILALDREIVDHAFQLFRDCCSATCLRNRSVEALATAALVQAIREAQEPRTLQEISTASNLPQKEIGKYIKILGEALKLSQPINSNSIAVHMPRFCTLLQINKSAQELAAHIGEVVVNKCFCTRRNPISISAAAIYLACQLEDKRKTQAEICKVTGLTEVTLRKVYKELLENLGDLLPANYIPAVPPEKAFPMTSITSGRSSGPKVDLVDLSHSTIHQDKDKQPEIIKPSKAPDVVYLDCNVRANEEVERRNTSYDRPVTPFDRYLSQTNFWQSEIPSGISSLKSDTQKAGSSNQDIISEVKSVTSDCEHKLERDAKNSNSARWMVQTSAISSSKKYSHLWQFNVPPAMPGNQRGTGTDGGVSQDKDEM